MRHDRAILHSGHRVIEPLHGRRDTQYDGNAGRAT